MYLQFFLKIINPIKQGYGFMVWAHGKAKETRIQYTYYQNQFQVEKILTFPGVTCTGIFTSTSENFK